MKIGIVCYPSVGGSGVVATELGKALAERGHEIHFISSSMPFRLRKVYANIFYHQVEVNQYSVFQYPPYEIQLASKIAEVASREHLDIVHAHYAIPHAICAYMGREMAERKFKIVTTLHGTDITILGQDPSLKKAIQFGIENSNVVTAVSNALVKETYELIAPKKDIQTVYNFIDSRVYQKVDMDPLRCDLGIKPEEKVVIHVSNFRAVKRVDDVVRTFYKINQKLPAKLLLVGDGPEITKITKLVDDLKLQEAVLFLGKQDNLEELYSISDLMLLLSEKESFGLVALEAMACGVPCIGTNVGGIPEVIENDKTGYICEVSQIDQMAKNALKILTDRTLHHQFATASMERAHRFFSAEQIVSQYEDIYYQLVEMDERMHD